MFYKKENLIFALTKFPKNYSQLNIQGPYSDTTDFFFHSFCCWTFAFVWIGKGSMFHFLETDIRKEK